MFLRVCLEMMKVASTGEKNDHEEAVVCNGETNNNCHSSAKDQSSLVEDHNYVTPDSKQVVQYGSNEVSRNPLRCIF